MAEVPQKSLERYDVLDRIAVGGMAEVFLAKAYGAHGFEKTLAIKRILPELARDPEFEERFIAEAKVAVRLSHTNVVQVFDFGRFAGSLFIAMEYVDGLDLAALLRRFKERHERVPLPAAFQIAIELARGLDFAHTHGVVHRDVSPSNILLSKAGEVKIADFGIAVAAAPGRATTGGGRRKVMGKWRYMSPEQARGEQLDTRSDMFSAASVMYELFTGEKLFPGDEAEDILRNIHEMPLPRPSEVRRGLPARLDEILHQALARRPGDRPTRPAVMLRALTELTYESSIVTTALDVAEAVSYVVDLSTPTGKRLDDIIRAQLANIAEPSVQRRTALGERRTAADESFAEVSNMPSSSFAPTGDRRTAEGSVPGDDERLTAVTIARRKKKTTGVEQAIGNDSGETRALDRSGEQPALPPIEGVPVLIPSVGSDGIRRLDVDETTMTVAPWELSNKTPPHAREPETKTAAGEVSSSGRKGPAAVVAAAAAEMETSGVRRVSTGPSPGASMTLITRRGNPAWMFPVALLALVALVAGVYFTFLRGSGDRTQVAGAGDAKDAAVVAPPVQPSVLIVETVPPGAVGMAGDIKVGPTPATLELPAGAAPLRLELAGYEPYLDDNVRVEPGQTLRLHLTLTPARARLAVETEPVGVDVELDGDLLGQTPLAKKDLPPRKTARLRLSKAGFVPQIVSVELIGGEEARVFRALKAAPTPMGKITLSVEDEGGNTWGDVSLGGKTLGRVGVGAASVITLPAGKHKLRIVNPATGKKASLDVDVRADQTRSYGVKLQ
ncbi:MAG TPA: serine/threonine-protein kinase [Kofleriaceae bacterium]|nr:serine/threonine-protein kinase [Kofleriaceae bacterium]